MLFATCFWRTYTPALHCSSSCIWKGQCSFLLPPAQLLIIFIILHSCLVFRPFSFGPRTYWYIICIRVINFNLRQCHHHLPTSPLQIELQHTWGLGASKKIYFVAPDMMHYLGPVVSTFTTSVKQLVLYMLIFPFQRKLDMKPQRVCKQHVSTESAFT